MISVNDFKEYKIIDMNNFEKLEDWNGVILRRPDPQIIWKKEVNKELWENVDAKYNRSNTGGGHWEIKRNIKNSWIINYKDMAFNLKLMNFKHTGLFPEQAVNWERMIKKIKESGRKDVKVLNLFAYTGGATVACLSAGASVVHVDSSKGINDWAKENVKSSGFENRPVRFLVDDVKKFVQREIRRGNKYDAIIMDPPSYGRGSNNEVWSIEKDLDGLLQSCKEILNDNFLFVCVNTYTANLSLLTLENILKVHFNNNIKVDEIALPIENSNLYLPCGITGWITND